MRLKHMKISSQLKGGIYDVNVGYTEVIRNSKNIFLRSKGMLGVQKGINLIFSKTKEGNNIVFSPFQKQKLYKLFNLI